jgi:hypothetical protein
MSRPRSMIAKPSRSCASVMQSGGLQVNCDQRTKVNRPSSLKNLARAFIAGWLPL